MYVLTQSSECSTKLSNACCCDCHCDCAQPCITKTGHNMRAYFLFGSLLINLIYSTSKTYFACIWIRVKIYFNVKAKYGADCCHNRDATSHHIKYTYKCIIIKTGQRSCTQQSSPWSHIYASFMSRHRLGLPHNALAQLLAYYRFFGGELATTELKHSNPQVNDSLMMPMIS